MELFTYVISGLQKHIKFVYSFDQILQQVIITAVYVNRFLSLVKWIFNDIQLWSFILSKAMQNTPTGGVP